MRPAAFLALALVPALFGCSAESADNRSEPANATAAPPPPVAAPPELPTVAEPLSRRDMLLAVAEAASDHSAGIAGTERQRALDGRPFAVALRFCPGDRAASFHSSVDTAEGVLRLEVRPDLTADSLGAIGVVPAPFEAVEGFWLHRPWLLDPACPSQTGRVSDPQSAIVPTPVSPAAGVGNAAPAVAVAPPPVAAPPSIGIAQFFDDSTPRSRRRGDRGYQVTRKLAEGEVAGPVDLLLEGRVSALPGGRTIVCEGGSATARPTCILSVRIDQVSLRRPDGAVLAKWGGA